MPKHEFSNMEPRRGAEESCCIGSSATEISSWTPPYRNHPKPTPKPCSPLTTQRHVSLWSSDQSVSTLFLCRQLCLSGRSHVDLPSAALSYPKCCRRTDNETYLSQSGGSSPLRRRDKRNNVFTLKVTQTAGAQQSTVEGCGGAGEVVVLVASFLEA